MKPTYEELEQEVARLRERVAPGADPAFTNDVAMAMKATMVNSLNLNGLVHGDTIVMTPSEIWKEIMHQPNFTTRETAKLGRSLLALGWVRSYKSGNLIYKIKVEDFRNV